MCVVAFSWNAAGETPLVLAANRDEFFDRPTAPMHWWLGEHVLAGRDLKANGAWLGVTRNGKFALLTNIRNPGLRREGAPSRGGIVRDFLESSAPPSAFVHELASGAHRFEGFNLLCGDVGAPSPELWFLHSAHGTPEWLNDGLYGLSNASLDTEWPKLSRIKQGLRHALAERDLAAQDARLLRLLRNSTPTPVHQLPSTGVPLEWERALGSVFINREGYGTRASAVLRVSAGRVMATEVNYAPDASVAQSADFSFEISPARP